MLKQDRPGLVLIGTLLLVLGTISLAVAISLRDNSGLFLPLIMLVAGLICLIAGISSMVSARKYNESIKEAYREIRFGFRFADLIVLVSVEKVQCRFCNAL